MAVADAADTSTAMTAVLQRLHRAVHLLLKGNRLRQQLLQLLAQKEETINHVNA